MRADAQASLDLYASAPLDLRTARMDGRPFDAMAAQWHAFGGKPDDDDAHPFRIRTNDPATVAAWLTASRNAQLLSFGDPASAQTARTPLTGLNAALLLIDDTRNRVSTVTALLRRAPARVVGTGRTGTPARRHAGTGRRGPVGRRATPARRRGACEVRR